MSNKKRLTELAGIQKRVLPDRAKKLKLSSLSEGLQAKVRKHMNKGITKLSELPESLKEQIKRETAAPDVRPAVIMESEFLPQKPKMDPKEYLEITTPIGSHDFKLFKSVVNQGIDSHLEGFTKSKFDPYMQDGQRRMCFNFHKSELPILLRRLEAMDDEEAYSWAQDIRDSENINESRFAVRENDRSNPYDPEKLKLLWTLNKSVSDEAYAQFEALLHDLFGRGWPAGGPPDIMDRLKTTSSPEEFVAVVEKDREDAQKATAPFEPGGEDDEPVYNADELDLEERAVSKAQQRFFGAVRSVQKGDTPAKKVSSQVRKAAHDMSASDVKDFASTKTDDLPEKVDEDIKFGTVDDKAFNYPELQSIVDTLADDVSVMINERAAASTSQHPYKTQWILEELIKELQSRV